MQPERRRLARLRRLEKVRAIAKQTAISAAAEAEGTLAQLQALALRSGQLAADYAGRSDAGDGLHLQNIGRFALGLQAVSARTLSDAARARTIADVRQQELAQAERRRAAAEERAVQAAGALAARADEPALGKRRSHGTKLD